MRVHDAVASRLMTAETGSRARMHKRAARNLVFINETGENLFNRVNFRNSRLRWNKIVKKLRKTMIENLTGEYFCGY